MFDKKIISDLQDLEMRKYPSVNWVCTEESVNIQKKMKKGNNGGNLFMKLFRYLLCFSDSL